MSDHGVVADQSAFVLLSIFNLVCWRIPGRDNLTKSTILATNLAGLTFLPLVFSFSGLAIDLALR